MHYAPCTHNPLRTREDVQRLALDLVEPILPYFSPGRAAVRVGDNHGLFGEPAGGLEGFARPLWGLVPLAAGGGDFGHWDPWLQGIAAGVDPAHAEFWGFAGDFDQRSVEQAAFGFALALAPEKFWDPLSPPVRDRLTAWLRHINSVKLVRSNWLFFRVLVNLGLHARGEGWAREQVEEDLALLEGFHVGDGWYADGAGGPPWRDGRRGDYYVPFAFQYYSLIYAKLAGADDPARTARFVERAGRFAQDFQHWFDASGAALPFGRSLTYRFSQGAFWGALAFAGVEALPWPVLKGLYLRHLRWWLRQPIFSTTGLLTIGYAYPNLVMAESYNSSQSPYWVMKVFLPLALPPEHPFWSVDEAPLPPRPAVRTVPGAKLILITDPSTRDVTAINPGQPVLDWPRHAPQKYSKCAYSTRFGFCVPTSVATPTEGGLDNGFSLSDDGRFFRAREHCLDPEVSDGVAFSRWQPWPDVEVRTWLLAEPTGHLRIHRLQTGRRLWSLEAGFAVPWITKATLQVDPAGPTVRAPGGVSVLRDLLGGRTGETVELGANSHLLSSLSSMPALRSTHEPGEHWLACWVGGTADDVAEDLRAAVGLTAVIDGEDCRVLRHGESWWTNQGGPCGESSAARIRSLGQPV